MKKFIGLLLFTFSLVAHGARMPALQTVFVIVLENHDWSTIKGNPDAPFLNQVLLPMASYCEEYYNPPGKHPSLPNYLWFEAGTNYGIYDDEDPATNHQGTTNHLVTQLAAAQISWKTYQEDIGGGYVPLEATNNYVPRHNPFIYFDDVTGTNNPNDPYGIQHIRPYSELAGDLTNNAVARYNFITPNLCNDTHDPCPPLYNAVRQGDNWLASEVPKILASVAYQNNGALFITWDEGLLADGPIGMLVISPLARGGGYYNSTAYTHSSLLRSLQEIFRVGPLLGDAANATNLSDLFSGFGFRRIAKLDSGGIGLMAEGLVPNRPARIEFSNDLINWSVLVSHIVATNTSTVIDYSANDSPRRFYRLVEE